MLRKSHVLKWRHCFGHPVPASEWTPPATTFFQKLRPKHLHRPWSAPGGHEDVGSWPGQGYVWAGQVPLPRPSVGDPDCQGPPSGLRSSELLILQTSPQMVPMVSGAAL